MKKEVTFREYRDQDEKKIEKIIRKTWNYDKFCDDRVSKLLSEVFLFSCLCNQTYTQVAEMNGELLGVIMAKNIKNHKSPLKYRLKLLHSLISIKRSKKGREALAIFEKVREIDDLLLKNSGKPYSAELAFFAMDSEYRGLGIGKSLFEMAKSYMESNSLEDFFLFTDTSCNFKFYDHLGMKKNNEEKTFFDFYNSNQDSTFFIYDFSFKGAVLDV